MSFILSCAQLIRWRVFGYLKSILGDCGCFKTIDAELFRNLGIFRSKCRHRNLITVITDSEVEAKFNTASRSIIVLNIENSSVSHERIKSNKVRLISSTHIVTGTQQDNTPTGEFQIYFLRKLDEERLIFNWLLWTLRLITQPEGIQCL